MINIIIAMQQINLTLA